jgi:hypothetical protein
MTALGVLHAHLLALVAAAGGSIDLAGRLRALCDAERLAAPRGAASVTLYADLRPVWVMSDAAAFVDLAFCELLHNALEHAFPRSGTGHVGVHLRPTNGLPGVRACLLVADDEQGFGAELPPRQSAASRSPGILSSTVAARSRASPAAPARSGALRCRRLREQLVDRRRARCACCRPAAAASSIISDSPAADRVSQAVQPCP